MLSAVLIGAFVGLVGMIGFTFNIAQGFKEHWPWVLMSFGVMVAGMILLYAAFRPVVL